MKMAVRSVKGQHARVALKLDSQGREFSGIPRNV
jgi:hypothetical protein